MKVITNSEVVELGNQYRVPKPKDGKLRYYIGSQGVNIGGVDDVDKAYDEIIKASLAGKDVVDLRDKPAPKPRAKKADAAEAEVKTEVVEDAAPETTA